MVPGGDNGWGWDSVPPGTITHLGSRQLRRAGVLFRCGTSLTHSVTLESVAIYIFKKFGLAPLEKFLLEKQIKRE